MQSDGNSFCGDVVLDCSFNKESWDENNILFKIYKDKYVQICIMMILVLYDLLFRKCTLTHLTPSLLEFKIFIIKFPKYLLCICLALDAFFIPLCYVKAVQDDISSDWIALYISWYWPCWENTGRESSSIKNNISHSLKEDVKNMFYKNFLEWRGVHDSCMDYIEITKVPIFDPKLIQIFFKLKQKHIDFSLQFIQFIGFGCNSYKIPKYL